MPARVVPRTRDPPCSNCSRIAGLEQSGLCITRDADRLSRDKDQLCGLLHRFTICGVRVQFANENGEAERKLLDLTLSALADLHEAKVADDARRARGQ
jgi:DNA invertase Pin-like site-specific DNA recombinase